MYLLALGAPWSHVLCIGFVVDFLSSFHLRQTESSLVRVTLTCEYKDKFWNTVRSYIDFRKWQQQVFLWSLWPLHPHNWLVQSIRPELSLSEWTLSQTAIGFPQDNHTTIALLGVFCWGGHCCGSKACKTIDCFLSPGRLNTTFWYVEN